MIDFKHHYEQYIKKRHLFVLTNQSGQIIASNNVGVDLSSFINEQTIFDLSPFFEIFRFEFETLEENFELYHDLVGLDISGKHETYDISMKKVDSSNFLFVIEKRTEKNQYWLEIQQERNESIINKELIEKQAKIINLKNEEITDSIKYSEKIQKAILPNKTLLQKLLPNSFVLFRPKDIVSGDFYWVAEKKSKVFFTAADCTGHGVPGSMMSMINVSLLKEAVYNRNLDRPAAILNYVRDQLIVALNQKNEPEGPKDGMDVALCVLNRNSILEYCGANNKLVLIRKGDDPLLYKIDEDNWKEVVPKMDCEPFKLYIIDALKQPVGQYIKMKPFTNSAIQTVKGDRVYLFSDGYIDQFGGEKYKKYSSKRFYSTLINIQQYSIQNQLKELNNLFDVWKGSEEQIDDVCILGVEL